MPCLWNNLHAGMELGIEHDLHELLYGHELVIVPQWGGFLTHYRPARLDEARKLVHPPGKDVSFNRHLTRTDGLLADHLARRTGTAFDAASARIEAEVAAWNSALERHGRVELPHIGIFYRDAEQNLQFDPDKRSNFLKEALGLRPVAAVPVQRIRMAAPVPSGPAVRTIAPKSAEPSKRTIIWAAAATVAVLFGAAAIWSYQLGQDKGMQWSALEMPWTKPERLYVPPSVAIMPPVATAGLLELPAEALGVKTLPLTPGDSMHITVDLGTPPMSETEVDSTHVAMDIPAVPRPSKKQARFHVVGGCFADPANAERFHGELLARGYDAQRLPLHGQLHPVAYGSYRTRAEALDALATVRGSGSGGAWLLVR